MLYERIKELCKEKGVTVSQMERDLGFAKGSISKIDKHKPSIDKIVKIAEYFNLKYEQFFETTYYENEQVRDYTAFLKDNPEYRVLFDASTKLDPKDITFVKEFIERIVNGRNT